MSISEGKVIFLFGAGVSLPAGLPGIAKMTSDFFGSRLSSDHHLTQIKERILRLWDITRQDFGARQMLATGRNFSFSACDR